MIHLNSFSISGLKSIRELTVLKPENVNILIGANGAGKSNLIFFFEMLSWAVKSPDRFKEKVAEWGGANALLFQGSKTTNDIEGSISIQTEKGENEYHFRLTSTGGDRLLIAEEKVRFTNPSQGAGKAKWVEIGEGSFESKLYEKRSENSTVRIVGDLLRQIFVYQFHDTSPDAPIRKAWPRNDGTHLKSNGSNLGSFILNLRETSSAHYVRMVKYIREIIPAFDDFEFTETGAVVLNWREKDTDYLFSSFQASDGTLRFIALVALLSQPIDKLPPVFFIDEPELGLHPQAIIFISGLIKKASTHSQIFVSTQSPKLVSQFEPKEVIVVEKQNGASNYRTLDLNVLEAWMDEFSLGEMWDHNLIGGRP